MFDSINGNRKYTNQNEYDEICKKQRKEEEKHYKRYKSNNYSFKGQNHGIPIM